MRTDADGCCIACGGSGEAEREEYAGHGEIRYRIVRCPECDGAGSQPPPTWMDGDWLRDRDDGY